MKFEIEKWIPEADGESRFARMATYGETCRAAVVYLTELRLFDKLEYLEAQGEEDMEIPRFHRLACYAAPHKEEGHEIFVEAIDMAGQRHPILAGKTFWGYFLACEIAGEIARFLYQDNS
ncbi:MAG: hypothetical protein JRH13_05840 [Deltaproteobacteria bacterium]|nr:hypothetical protein [Deltaproteobacteria bacterium]MBW2015820.1 hypothetical protein [Deltaproteobacteria bacterium]MBW2128867.1 hypothetical protein [Deltaproteobacteria bacterium]MBW2304454.1 hypothetical protein [Deltaproteobacteria bacterium]